MSNLLHKAVLLLAGQCDGAHKRDDVGFNRMDADLGHKLSQTAFDLWTPAQKWAAWKMLKKYQGQLKGYGVDYDTIPQPPAVVETKTIKLTPTAAEIRFPYDPGLVEAVREIPGRKWEKESRVWTVPLTTDALAKLQDFCEDYGFNGDTDKVADLAGKMKVFAVEAIEASKATTADVEVEGLGGTLRPFQKAGVKYAVDKARVLIGDEMGLGKSQPISEPILTPTGWRPIGEIEVGDLVIGRNGMPTEVLGVYPQGQTRIARLTFGDGTWVRASWDHLWTVQHVRNDTARQYPATGGRWRTMTTSEIADTDKDKAQNANWRVPMVGPVAFEPKTLPLDPYLLGMLLGDGGITTAVRFSTADAQLVNEVRARVPAGITVKYVGAFDYNLSSPGPGIPNPIIYALQTLGLMGKRSESKFVPEIYRLGSIEQRLALLRGLMDTDGTVRRDGTTQFTTVSERLAADVTYLIETLGGSVRRTTKMPRYTYRGKHKSGQLAYTLTIAIPLNPFRLPRKAIAWTPRMKYVPSRIIRSVADDGFEDAVCIRVAAPDQLYVTRSCIVTHNTIEALATIQALHAYPALVICPATIKFNWYNETRKWLPGKTIQILGTETVGRADANVTIINYDQLKRYRDYLVRREFKAVIADESHFCKSSKSQRTQFVEEIVNGCIYARGSTGKLNRRNKEQLRKPIDVRLLLSGTPLLNRPEELVSQLQILDRLQEFGGWYGFMREFCGLTQTRWGMDTSGAKNLKNLKKLNDTLRSLCYIRRLKSEVLTELPPKQRTVILTELTNRVEYDRAERDLIQWLKETQGKEKADAAARAEQLVRIEALKQLAARGKMAAIKEWVENFLDTGEKLVIFGWHKEIVIDLSRTFQCDALYGGTPPDRRQGMVDRFQDDSAVKVLAANVQTGGIGLTLTAASNVLFVEFGWNPGTMNQASDRCHRIGQKDNVMEWWFIGRKTIDEDIQELIEAKRAVVDAATDGVEQGEDVSVMNELVARLRGDERSSTGMDQGGDPLELF